MIRYLHHHHKTTLLTSVLLSVSLSTTSAAITTTMAASLSDPVDPQYPGTATLRLRNIHQRISNLTATPGSFDGEWENVRTTVLFAGGLKDLKSSRPGHGYTGHSFNDWNHCDLTAMRGQEAHNINAGAVDGIAYGEYCFSVHTVVLYIAIVLLPLCEIYVFQFKFSHIDIICLLFFLSSFSSCCSFSLLSLQATS